MLGISRDGPEAQKRFGEKLGLPFPLRSDSDTRVQRARLFPKVKVDGHVGEVLAAL